MAASLIAAASVAWAGDSRHMTYDDFIRQVEAGNVRSVALDSFSSISGVLVDGTTTNQFRSYGKAGSANDPLLARLLKEHDVTVSIRDTSKPIHTMPMITGFLFILAPIAFLIFLIIINTKLNQILASQKSSQQD